MLSRIVLRKKGKMNTIIIKGRSNRLIDYMGYVDYSKYKNRKVYCINLEKFMYWYHRGINLRRSNKEVLKYCFFLVCLNKNVKEEYELLKKSYFRKR